MREEDSHRKEARSGLGSKSVPEQSGLRGGGGRPHCSSLKQDVVSFQVFKAGVATDQETGGDKNNHENSSSNFLIGILGNSFGIL